MYIDILNDILHNICAEIILNEKVSKLLYYNDVMNKDIYSLAPLDNPMKTLYNDKVFKGKRVDKIQSESDIGLSVGMTLYEPYQDYYKTSGTVKHIQYDIIIICHDECINTLNGNRCLALIEEITNTIYNSKYIKSIGNVTLCQAFPVYDVPQSYEGWAIRLDVQIINTHQR